MSRFDLALQVADTVLYEGYVLYPYRASAQKNQMRWQFGVLVPRDWSEAGSEEPWSSQTECLVEPRDAAMLRVKVRFLQAQRKSVEADDGRGGLAPVASLRVGETDYIAWDEGFEQEIDAEFRLAELIGGERVVPIEIAGGRDVERIEPVGTSRVIRERWPLSGLLRVAAERLAGPYGLVKIRVRVENLTPWNAPGAGRDEALRRSLLTAHSLLNLTDAAFVSLLEPPEWARPAVASCDNRQTWPVLVGAPGQRDLVLSSPIILYDYPAIAPESPGHLFDATEIDEILTLRTMTLTDEEKREARATDPRAAAVIDRVDSMPQEMLDRLHGSIRFLRDVTGPHEPEPVQETPWWDPAADSSVSPETDSVFAGGVEIARGSRVRLAPGTRRADAQDMFLIGRIATVEAVIFDIDDGAYLAVTLADDPNADIAVSHGRFLYFSPDEVEPLEAGE